MEITLDSYINNPMGGRTHMVGQRQAAAANYTDKFDKLLMKSAGMIEHYLYRTAVDPNRVEDKPNNNIDRYIIIIKIPSEKIPRVEYDVAVEFYTKDTVCKKSTTLDNYYVKFFSNDPNFNFTYAYTFKKNHLIINELVSKLDPKAMKEPPKVTNPNTLVGYVKSIYFAYLFIQNRGLMNKFNWYGAPPINSSKMLSHIMSTSAKLTQVQRLTTLYNATKKGSMVIGDTDTPGDLEAQVNKVKSAKKAQKTRINDAHRIHTVSRTKQVSKVRRVKR